jgi:hypothetical protein
MRFVEAPQGSPEWFQARVGKITASCFADATSVMQKNSATRKVGEPTAAAERYAADLAIERISNQPHGEPPKAWVLERGHEMEARARMLYEARTGAFITESGICISDDGLFGYSSDGLADDDGLIEIKAPIDSIKIMDMWRTGDTSEYDHQIQGGLWLTGRKWLDFIMFVPDLAACGKDLYVKRIYRDEEFIDKMVAQLAEFDRLVETFTFILRADTVAITITEEPMTTETTAPAPSEMLASAPVEAASTPPGVTTPEDQAYLAEHGQDDLAKMLVNLNGGAPVPPSLRLGQITERLGFGITAAFLGTLGFEPAGRDKSAVLFHEHDFKAICAAILRHVSAVQAKF